MRRCDLVFPVSLLFVSFFACTTAFASITLVGQDRRVQSSAFVTIAEEFDSDSQQIVAPDGAPFDASASVTASVVGAVSSASANQTSSVGLHAIHALGAYAAQAENETPEGAAFAHCETNVALRFSISEPTTYFLHGFIEAFEGGVANIQFSRPFLTIEWFSASNERIDLDEFGSLAAGTYDLNMTANGVSNTDTGVPAANVSGAYEIHLVLGSATDAPLVARSALAVAPNPFTTETRIALPTDAGRVRVVDLSGRIVRTLAGASPLSWDGRDDQGRSLGAGVYWVRVEDVASEPIKIVRLR